MGEPHVVVVGAGFAGLAAARALAGAAVRVTVVDARNHHTFQPLLYQVATAGLSPDDIAQSVRGIIRHHPNVGFRLATVRGVDLDGRRLLVEDGAPVSYDFLVLAAGAATAYPDVPGLRAHAFAVKSLDEAVRLRSHVLGRFEAAAADPGLVDDGALTVVIAGGGSTGLELAGALVELFSMVLTRDFPALDVGRAARVVLVERSDHLLPPFQHRSRASALATVRSRGVDVRLGTTVEEVLPRAVRLSTGQALASHTLVWCAGIRAHPLADVLGVDQGEGGRVVVGEDLSVPRRPEVFVVGDLAAARDAHGRLYPQLAPVAIQQGRHVARQVLRQLDGEPRRTFRYRNRGIMATIGRRAAVAELPLGLRFRGTLAWLMWLGLHLVQLIGFRNRSQVLLDWAWNYVTYDRAARLITSPGDDGRPPASLGPQDVGHPQV